jgi:hypothetical protein
MHTLLSAGAAASCCPHAAISSECLSCFRNAMLRCCCCC